MPALMLLLLPADIISSDNAVVRTAAAAFVLQMALRRTADTARVRLEVNGGAYPSYSSVRWQHNVVRTLTGEAGKA